MKGRATDVVVAKMEDVGCELKGGDSQLKESTLESIITLLSKINQLIHSEVGLGKVGIGLSIGEGIG